DLGTLESRFQPDFIGISVSKFDLTAEFSQTPHGLSGLIQYATALYNPGTIARMARHLEVLLQGMARDAEASIDSLELLTAEERRQMVEEWNRTQQEYGSGGKCVHELFEEQVRRTPDAVAVEDEGQAMSYRELERRANQLGRYLRGKGVGPEICVGLCLGR